MPHGDEGRRELWLLCSILTALSTESTRTGNGGARVGLPPRIELHDPLISSSARTGMNTPTHGLIVEARTHARTQELVLEYTVLLQCTSR